VKDNSNKPIFDPCCGGRMFYFDKQNPNVLFCDNREFDGIIWTSKDGKQTRTHTVKPDMLCDVTELPFDDESFWHVVFDPPHVMTVGDNAWLAKKYGKLPKDWKTFIKSSFDECWRVLKPNGTLVFKWCEESVTTGAIIDAIGRKPLYGQKVSSKRQTHWLCFVKVEKQ
jgi:Predicted DNA modification methylase